jgi:purine-binding chemotaxis protein CheW
MHPMASFPQHPFLACLFGVAGQTFGLRLESVSEIVPMAALSRPPSMPSVLEGFLNLGGAAIPVLRIAGLLGLPEERPALHTPLMVIRSGTLTLALLVNRVIGIVSIPVDGLVPIPETDSFNGCVDGRLLVTGDVAHLLSLDRLLLEKEQRTLAEFQATETRRLHQLEQVSS